MKRGKQDTEHYSLEGLEADCTSSVRPEKCKATTLADGMFDFNHGAKERPPTLAMMRDLLALSPRSCPAGGWDTNKTLTRVTTSVDVGNKQSLWFDVTRCLSNLPIRVI